MKHDRTSTAARALGFTLVELLVALAIGLILMTGIYQFFISQRRTYSTQDEVLRMQQKARVANDLITRAIQQTGAYAPTTGTTISLRGQVLLAASDRYLTLQYDDPYRTADAGVVTAPEVVTFAPSKPTGTATEYVEDATGTANSVQVYFDQDGDGTVESTEKYEVPIPLVLSGPPYTLYRITPNPTTPTGDPTFEAVADQVENFVLRYYDHNGNPIPADPTTGAALSPPFVLTPAQRALVRSMDVELTLRTRNKDPKYTVAVAVEDYTVGTYDTAGNPQTGITRNDGYRRRVFKNRVTPRNLSVNSCGRITLSANPVQPQCPASSTLTAVLMDQYGSPLAGKSVSFSVDPGSGATLSVATGTTNTSGEVTTTLGYLGLARSVAVSAQAVVDCSPSGPSSFTLINATPVNFVPGTASTVTVDNLLVDGTPSPLTVYTCKDPKTFTFDAHAFDQCGNEVNPEPGLSFEPIDSGSSVFGSLVGSVSGTAEFQSTGETFTVTPDTTAPETVNVRGAAPLPGWLTGLTGLPFSTGVSLVAWPPSTLTNWSNQIHTTAHTDCPSPDVTSTFQVFDCVANIIDDLTLETGYEANAAITPDPSGPTGAPEDQGTLYSAASIPAGSAAASIAITQGSLGSFNLSYKPPQCTVGPPSTNSASPLVTLELAGPGIVSAPQSQTLTLGGCQDCEITASSPTLNSSICSTNTQTTVISVGACGVPDGTPVELEVTSTGGNASWALTGTGLQTTTLGYFSGNTVSATLYKGAAVTGDILSIYAYVPDKATYLAAKAAGTLSKDVFMCQAADLIIVSSECDSIYLSNRSFTSLGVSPSQTLTRHYPAVPSFQSGEEMYIEVFDCDENENSSVRDTLEVVVTSPQGYSPPAPDVERVILTETGADTGIFRNDTNPLPLIFCGLPPSGDTSGNGYLFVRQGYPVTIQYTDDDDPNDNGCRVWADINGFACQAFNYSYFAENYIHLDRHGVAANLTIGGNVWTNGEFELSSDMLADARGPDRTYGTGDDDAIVAMGHVSNGGRILGDVYAPSYDAYGPDGEGQNTQNFGTHAGTITGNIYLRDGFRYDANTLTYSVETVGDDPWEKVPSYGAYQSRAAQDLAQPPPGSSVTVHPIGNRATQVNGSVFSNYALGSPKFDPNANATYAQDPPRGQVLVAKELPTFDLTAAKANAQSTTSDYAAWAATNGVSDGVDSDTYFASTAAFQQFIRSTAGKTFIASDGTSYQSTAGIYIIGDHVNGTIFYVEGNLDFTAIDLGGAQLIVNGALVATGSLSIKGAKKSATQTIGGIAIYGCGLRPVNWRAGWTGTIYEGKGSDTDPHADLDWFFADRGGPEDIPYALPCLIGMTKVEVKDRSTHTLTSGIVYSKGEIHYHNATREGKAFLVGAEIGNIIHNCLYIDFQYDTCVKASAQDWFGCFCDTGGTPISCQISVTPSAATVVQSTGIVNLTASATGGTPTYQWSLSGSSGGGISATGNTGVYTAGGSIGTDTITVQDASGTCLPTTATVTTIGSCTVSVSPATATVPVTQSQTLTASSTGGGPFTWSITQNQSGGSLGATTGGSVVYTAGASGGTDIIQVTDATGCSPARIVLTIDPCFVQVAATTFNGANCTSTLTNHADPGGTVCLSGIGGDGEYRWFTDDPAGQFSFDGGTTWVPGTSAAPTGLTSMAGVSILYKAGATAGTYTVTGSDLEDCQGNQLLTTCGMTFDPHAPSIFETQTLALSVSGASGTPVLFDASPISIGVVSDTPPSSATFTPLGAGSAILTAIDAVGCTAASSVRINPCPPITITRSPPAPSLIVGQAYTLTASGGTGPYAWNLDAGSGTLTKTGTNTATFVATATTAVTISTTDANGCPGAFTTPVSCPAIAVTHAPADSPLAAGTDYTLTGSGGTGNYTWHLLSGAGTLTGSGATATYTAGTGGSVSIQATDGHSCTGLFTETEGICPAKTPMPDTSTVVGNGTGITTLAIALNPDGACLAPGDKFKLTVKGGGMDWSAEVWDDGTDWWLKVKDKVKGQSCSRTQSKAAWISDGLLDIDKGYDILDFKSSKVCSLKQALTHRTGNFTVTMNKKGEYTNCDPSNASCGGWYDLVTTP